MLGSNENTIDWKDNLEPRTGLDSANASNITRDADSTVSKAGRVEAAEDIGIAILPTKTLEKTSQKKKTEAGRVNETSITDIPPEIMKAIFEYAFAGQSKRDLGRFVRSCRATYHVGLEILYRDVSFSNQHLADYRLQILMAPPTSINKMDFVQVLRLPSGLSWNQPSLELLIKCLRKLPNLKCLELAAGGKEHFHVIWNVMNTLPKLEELTLRLQGTSAQMFHPKSVFPTGVRVLHLEIGWTRTDAMNKFLDMIDKRAPNLEHVYLEGSYRWTNHFMSWNLPLRPCLRGKIRSASSSSRDVFHVPDKVVDLLIGVEYWQPPRWRWHELTEIEDLRIENIRTTGLLALAGHLPKLKKLLIVNPVFKLAPEQYALAADAICRPGVETIINLSTDGYRSPEKRYWKANPDVKFVIGEIPRLG